MRSLWMRKYPRNQVRLCLVGPSGAGKSTAAFMMQCLVPGAVVVSVAQPLRDVEDRIFEVLGKARPLSRTAQDAKLLQQVRELLLERDPHILTRRFMESVAAARESPLLINADARAAMRDALTQARFIIISIERPLASVSPRLDISLPQETSSLHDSIIQPSESAFSVVNDAGLDLLLYRVRTLVETLVPSHG